ncbi:helix-turn-helix transcriptional regulator [Actinosynnema sp. NPDC047251]|uniref:Transcriptional regulator, XRE family n=1 Tax=Saccharothrix espanaensis (strain ATCC 51144 / DSM 44229 / JCM 9112 / NBRC 15066 / NRRL 15764) TaxID=1179773 RepID=K0JTB2_SACES|nr:helix-turn-helix transcriptional regulator [Saccharothrix espanaensis]CCH28054.1 Transcriptional regulator, XRE family [Saccharothrix espanaensis DSM 44229]
MESNARARTLGAELRDLRKAKRLSMVRLGDQVGIDKSTLSRVERGERPATETETASILGALGVVGAKRRELLTLAREAAKSNWLATGPGVPPQQLKALMEYERVATFMMEVNPLLVPGLLQTPDYALTIMTEGGLSNAEAHERVGLRLDRQRVITRDADPVPYLSIMDEFVLRRPVGGRAVMAGQLRHLAAMARRDNVTVRVVPKERGYHPGLYGSFVLLESARTAPVVHLEHLRSNLFLYKWEDVRGYIDLKSTLLAATAGVEESMDLIEQCAEDMEGRRSGHLAEVEP